MAGNDITEAIMARINSRVEPSGDAKTLVLTQSSFSTPKVDDDYIIPRDLEFLGNFDSYNWYWRWYDTLTIQVGLGGGTHTLGFNKRDGRFFVRMLYKYSRDPDELLNKIPIIDRTEIEKYLRLRYWTPEKHSLFSDYCHKSIMTMFMCANRTGVMILPYLLENIIEHM